MQVKAEGANDLLSKLNSKQAGKTNAEGIASIQPEGELGEFEQLLNVANERGLLEQESEGDQNLFKLLAGNGKSSDEAALPEGEGDNVVLKMVQPGDIKKQSPGMISEKMGSEELAAKIDIIAREHEYLDSGSAKTLPMGEMAKAKGQSNLNDDTNNVVAVSKDNLIAESSAEKVNIKTDLDSILGINKRSTEASRLGVESIGRQSSNLVDQEHRNNLLNQTSAKNLGLDQKQEGLRLVKQVNSPLDLHHQQGSEDFLNQLNKAVKVKEESILPNVAQRPAVKLTKRVGGYAKDQNLLNNNIIKQNISSRKTNSIGSDLSEALSLSDSGLNTGHSGAVDGLGQLKSEIIAPNITTVKPVLNLSSVDAKNGNELINKISNYIEQSYISSKESMDIIVRHDDLGTFQLMAKKNQHNNQAVDLKINTFSENGQRFFADHENELIKSLGQNGVKVSDFKIVSSRDFSVLGEQRSSSSSDRSFQNSNSDGQSQGRQQESSQGKQDSQRRRELWKDFSEQRAYA